MMLRPPPSFRFIVTHLHFLFSTFSTSPFELLRCLPYNSVGWKSQILGGGKENRTFVEHSKHIQIKYVKIVLIDDFTFSHRHHYGRQSALGAETRENDC